ncbi:hypothetical protein V7G11_11330, partial [Cutibacterium avidum]
GSQIRTTEGSVEHIEALGMDGVGTSIIEGLDPCLQPHHPPFTGMSHFDAGICTGKFHNPQIIKNRLEWGDQSSCKSTATPNDLYRHSIHVDIRQGNPKITSFGIMHKVSEYTSLNGPYSRVATAVATNPCKKNTKANYDVVARVTVHSVQFRAVVSKTMTNLSCNVAP